MLYNIATHAWPSDRLAIIADPEEFAEWNQAALKKRLIMSKWIEKTLNSAAFFANNAAQIDAVNDLKAFEKASRGGMVSYDEYERAQRYRANHPAEAAEADSKRPAEDHTAAMLRDKELSNPKP